MPNSPFVSMRNKVNLSNLYLLIFEELETFTILSLSVLPVKSI